ncbi:MAG: hypothetical protein O3C10_04735 [Chloroflexi bacterium]|nr:hypothetical protein [Chloroflexota bacterium]
MEKDTSIGSRHRRTLVSGRLGALGAALAFLAVITVACGSESAPAATPEATARSTSPPVVSETTTPLPTRAPIDTTSVVSDFELPRAGGGTVTLSDVYSASNTVLVFYRGFF